MRQNITDEPRRDVIAKSEIGAGKKKRARSYLEKMAQVKLDIPPLRPTQSRELIETLLNTLLARHKIELGEPETYRLWRIYENNLARSLSEPRQVKKFCGQIEALYPLVGSEVDFIDFAVITWLRLFYPEILNVLIEHKGELTGTALVVGDQPSQQEASEKWRRILKEANAACDVNEMLGLLSELFPALEKAVSPFGQFVTDKGRPDSKRIGSVEYFDRYIYLGVGPGDILDSEISQALVEVFQSGTRFRLGQNGRQSANACRTDRGQTLPTCPRRPTVSGETATPSLWTQQTHSFPPRQSSPTHRDPSTMGSPPSPRSIPTRPANIHPATG